MCFLVLRLFVSGVCLFVLMFVLFVSSVGCGLFSDVVVLLCLLLVLLCLVFVLLLCYCFCLCMVLRFVVSAVVCVLFSDVVFCVSGVCVCLF